MGVQYPLTNKYVMAALFAICGGQFGRNDYRNLIKFLIDRVEAKEDEIAGFPDKEAELLTAHGLVIEPIVDPDGMNILIGARVDVVSKYTVTGLGAGAWTSYSHIKNLMEDFAHKAQRAFWELPEDVQRAVNYPGMVHFLATNRDQFRSTANIDEFVAEINTRYNKRQFSAIEGAHKAPGDLVVLRGDVTHPFWSREYAAVLANAQKYQVVTRNV